MGIDSTDEKSCGFCGNQLSRPCTPSKLDDALSALQTLQNLPVKPRVLLVDDDCFNQCIFGALLEEAGVAFDIANDGSDAIAKVKSNVYGLILMDVQMPIMSGLEATRIIRQLPDQQNLPIVAITANTFEEDRMDCFEAGMDAFLPKPVKPETLFQELLKWLRAR